MFSSSEEGEWHTSNSSSDSGENPPEILRFIELKSKRGASILARDGFEYQFERNSSIVDNIEYWKCLKRPPYCTGRIHVHAPWQEENGVRFKLGTVKNDQHTHNAEPDKEDVRLAIERLKQSARAPNPLQTRDAVDAARAALAEEIRVNAPSSNAMAKVFRFERRKTGERLGDRGMDALNPLEIVIPQYLEPCVIRNENLVIGGQMSKIIVFASQNAMQILDRYRGEIAIDGTFKTAARGFGQLFTLHAVVDSCAVPCVFACLPTKHMQGYVSVFEAIQNQIPNWTPDRVMSDFEASEIAAIRHIFPEATITGCVFHLGNAIYKHIQSLPGLNDRYKNNRNGDRHLFRSLQSLAFVPMNEVYVFMCVLIDALMIRPDVELLELLKYFVLTYIGPSYVIAQPQIIPVNDVLNYGNLCDGWLREWIQHENLAHRNALFPIELWNVTERLQGGLSRSNNSLEAWHNVWGALLEPRPLFSKFVRRMVKEFDRWEHIVADFHNAPAHGIRGKGLKRKSIYIEQDNNLRQIFAEFEQRAAEDPLRYLRTISYHLAEH